jgi:hypothetical protein
MTKKDKPDFNPNKDLTYDEYLEHETYEDQKFRENLDKYIAEDNTLAKWLLEQNFIDSMIHENLFVEFFTKDSSFWKKTKNYDPVQEKDFYKSTFIVQIKRFFILDVVKYQNELLFQYKLNGVVFNDPIGDLITKLTSFIHLTTSQKQLLTMFFNNVLEKFDPTEIHDFIYIDKEKRIKFELEDKYNDTDIKKQLLILNELYKVTTHPKAFVIAFCYNLLTIFATFIKDQDRIFPYLAFLGRSQSGKTSMLSLFIRKGFDQKRSESKVIANDISSIFTLTKYLGGSLLPIIIDDITSTFLIKNADSFQGGSMSNRFGSRGRKDQSIRQYKFSRQPVFTTNDPLQLQLASSIRMIQVQFSHKHKSKQNIAQWSKISNDITPGFMYKIAYDIFNKKNFNSTIKNKINDIDFSEKYNQNLLDLIFIKLKKLYLRNDVEFIFKPINIKKHLQKDNSMEEDFIEWLVTEWELIHDAELKSVGKEYFKHPNLHKNILHLKDTKSKRYIYFTVDCLKIYGKTNREFLFKNLDHFINNSTLDPLPEAKSHRFNGSSPKRSVKIKMELPNDEF